MYKLLTIINAVPDSVKNITVGVTGITANTVVNDTLNQLHVPGNSTLAIVANCLIAVSTILTTLIPAIQKGRRRRRARRLIKE